MRWWTLAVEGRVDENSASQPGLEGWTMTRWLTGSKLVLPLSEVLDAVPKS